MSNTREEEDLMEAQHIPGIYARDAILHELIELLNELGSDWELGLDGGIGPETRLIADLGFRSIDVVQLAIAVEEHFQRRSLPFQTLLTKADGRPVEDLSVAELADFLEIHLKGGQER